MIDSRERRESIAESVGRDESGIATLESSSIMAERRISTDRFSRGLSRASQIRFSKHHGRLGRHSRRRDQSDREITRSRRLKDF